MRREREEDRLWSRWPVFAAALLIAALFGILSGAVKDAQFPRGLQSAGKGTETPHLSKREPIRALAAADRKDGAGAYASSSDGALLAGTISPTFPVYAAAIAPALSIIHPALSHWPAPLPRAPPAAA
ncbi:hypothetical protein [Rhizobium terrae]|uniref:hypothetical protein n=1 Tax=Rhizobium terrae TaxID=2171756 RepID=UPI0013C309F7|nr:hypothetical protein [Rhizobium terrae]